MNKLSIIAGAILLTAGIAAASPSLAANVASCTDEVSHNDVNSGGDQSFIDVNSASILSSLRAKGIDARDVSDWGGCVKADVVRANGHVAQEFFDPGTLQRLHVNRG